MVLRHVPTGTEARRLGHVAGAHATRVFAPNAVPARPLRLPCARNRSAAAAGLAHAGAPYLTRFRM
jgi:hypothetical protein